MRTSNSLFFFCALFFNLSDSVKTNNEFTIIDQLPQWISSNPGFDRPVVIDSINSGNGSVETKKKEDSGWLIHLNDKRGFGVEFSLDTVSLSLKSNSYLAFLPWPLTKKNLEEIKIFSGNFKETEKVRIPATKSILVLYGAQLDSENPDVAFSYKRYGVSFEKSPPTTESPIKKETLYEIALKGKAPDEYFDEVFVVRLKKAFVEMARAFCLQNQIPFNETADPRDMVFVSRVSFCPFEWPERDLCALIQHSIYVSGTKVANGIIMDYEMTADHLRKMWLTVPPFEIQKLGLTIFKLPETSDTVLWWCLIAVFVMALSLIGILLQWGFEKMSHDVRFRSHSRVSEQVTHRKKTISNLPQHQKIPSFMCCDDIINPNAFQNSPFVQSSNKSHLLKESTQTGSLDDHSTKAPIKNYIGGFLFNNKAFEDDEETVIHLKKK